MKRLIGVHKYLSLTVLMAIGLTGIGQLVALADGGIATGHILVRIQNGVDAQRLASDYSSYIVDHVSNTTLYSFALPINITEAAFAAKVGTDIRVVYAELDNLVTSPEVKGEPFHFAFDLNPKPITYVNSVAYTQVNLGKVDAFNQINGKTPLATGAGIVVAVLDTGVTFNHPALQGHLLAGFNAINPGAPPKDLPDGLLNNEVGHGTMVIGIIARIASQSRIMPVRVLNGDGTGTMLNLVAGIHYATTHGARVINMSFGCSAKSSALSDALDEAELAGVILVASAGNDSTNQILSTTTNHASLPVAAVEWDNKKSPYSNFGSFVRVVAPGSSIRSTYWDGGYASWSGTSFAAPFVSAEAALILSNQPIQTAASVISSIRKATHSVDAFNPTFKGQLGNGIIDIEMAVKNAGK